MSVTLSETVDEYSTFCCPIQDDRAETTRFALPLTCHTLLEYTATEIGIDLPFPCTFNSFVGWISR